jgi:hypothetical protein
MKTVFKNLLAVVIVTFMSVSCSKSDSGSGSSNSNCISGSLALSSPVVDNLPSSNSIIVTFNVKNNSSKNLSITNPVGSRVYTKMLVKDTDGTVLETKGPLLVQELSAGATTSVDVLGKYTAGKTYASYTIELYCE